MFPVLSRIAMDLISVQATSVAFEFAFSTSERVLSIRRTKLTPSSLEMCMCLKDHLDAQERKQHTSILENALNFEDEILDAEVQKNEATPLSDEKIVLDAASQGTIASGSGGEEQDFDYDLTNYDIDDHFQFLSNESMFPVLSRIAMDLISVQATSVAFEFVFSTSGRVLSIRRTKLTPSSLEMCMCLKDHLDAQKRKQHTSTLENALDFEDEILDAEVQENEATPLSDEEIALDAASQGTMASDSGGEEQDFDYDLTNYDIDDQLFQFRCIMLYFPFRYISFPMYQVFY
uniref:Transposase n=1 Tax=Tanacetum cinerariifolium TaxID=118510 RepID=A0A6L2LWR3_TANCI|nr:transposase [Tanacetum cinerariifolium]